MRQVVRPRAAPLLAWGLLLVASAANAVDSGDVIVVKTKGEVHITVNGAARKVSAGGVLELPATVRTGRDGSIELRQGATSVSVGPETLLEFPALEKRGAPIDRILQPRGNVFYNIGKREGRKLRVETPYLVGVIKGTQFNVAAQDESTTISLFEGLLEVRSADDSDVVDLKAGEIASRSRGGESIGIMKMNSGKAPPAAPRAPPGSGSNSGTPNPGTPRAAPSREDTTGNDEASLLVDRDVSRAPVEISVGTDPRSSATPDTGTIAAVVADPGVSAAVDVAVVAVDVAAGVAADAVADVAAGAAMDAGPVTAAVDTSANLDVGAATVDTSVSAGVDAGPLTTDVTAGVAADLPTGTVSVGVSVPGADLSVDVDLGLDDDDNSGPGSDDGNNGHGNDDDHSDSSNPGHGNSGNTTVVDVGELLDSLSRGKGSKK